MLISSWGNISFYLEEESNYKSKIYQNQRVGFCYFCRDQGLGFSVYMIDICWNIIILILVLGVFDIFF